MQRRSVILAAALAIGLSACATPTPYQARSAGQADGYWEEKLSDSQYRVVFAGNAHTPRDRVEQFLLRRAAEITIRNGHEWFRVSDQRTEGNVRIIQTAKGPVRVSQGPGYRGWRDFGNIYTRKGLGLFGPIWRSLNPGGERLEASAEIAMGSGPAPAAEGVFDAREVLRKLGEG